MGIEKKHFVKRSAFSLNTFRINEIVNKTLCYVYVKWEQRNILNKSMFPEEERILASFIII